MRFLLAALICALASPALALDVRSDSGIASHSFGGDQLLDNSGKPLVDAMGKPLTCGISLSVNITPFGTGLLVKGVTNIPATISIGTEKKTLVTCKSSTTCSGIFLPAMNVGAANIVTNSSETANPACMAGITNYLVY